MSKQSGSSVGGWAIGAVLALAVLGIGGVVWAISGDEGQSAAVDDAAGAGRGEVLPATPIDEEPGLAHVHGLGVNPADGLVYAATHFGLWRLPEKGEPERVGDYYHDLMGFSVAGADHFYASGHPVLTDDLPPLLGLIESTDGGRTWRSVSLLGAVDFHALRVAHDQVYGWSSSDSQFLVSEDGAEWESRSQLPLFDFVVHPDEPEVVIGTVAESFDEVRSVRSEDGGRTWIDLETAPVARLAWEDTDRLWGVGMGGQVWRSADGGASWEQVGEVAGRPEALVDTGEALIVAAGGAIMESTDEGKTWADRYRTE